MKKILYLLIILIAIASLGYYFIIMREQVNTPTPATSTTSSVISAITYCGNMSKIESDKLNNPIVKRVIEASNSNSIYTRNICENHKLHTSSSTLDVTILENGDVKFESIIYNKLNDDVYGENGFDGSKYGPIK